MIDYCSLLTERNLERGFELYGFDDTVKTQLTGLFSNLESAVGIVDSIIAFEVFKTYLICLCDVGSLDKGIADFWIDLALSSNSHIPSFNSR